MSSVPDWLLTIAGLGRRAVGFVITTFDTQARERCAARGERLSR